MFKICLTSIALLFSTSLWSLTCSAPITISDQRYNAKEISHIFASENGNAVVSWITSPEPFDEGVCIATKNENGWSAPQTISELTSIYSIFKTSSYINNSGDIQATWIVEGDDDEDHSYILYKKNEAAWGNPNEIEAKQYSSQIAYNREDHLVFINNDTFEFSNQFVEGHIYSPEGELINNFKIPVTDSLIFDVKINDTGEYFVWRNSSYVSNNYLLHGCFLDDLTPKTIYTSASHIYDTQIAVNPMKNIAVAWEEKNNIYVITNFDQQWSQPVAFSWPEGIAEYPTIAMDEKGNIFVTWISFGKRRETICAAYKPVGMPWSAPFEVSARKERVSECKVQSDLAGNFVVIWEQKSNKSRCIYGATFSTETQQLSSTQLSPQGQFCIIPVFTFWGPGKGYISWMTSAQPGDRQIQVAELSNE